MKTTIYKTALTAAFICLYAFSYAQIPYVTIAPWQGNKKAAVSVTLDDGCVNQFQIGQPIMDNLGIKGTFNIITDLASNCDGKVSSQYANIYQGPGSPQYWVMLQNAIDAGHEIAAHTVHHYYLDSLWHDTTKVPGGIKEWRDTVAQEIKDSKFTLQQNLYEANGNTPYSILTFAYPYGSGQNTQALVDTVQKYFMAARAAGTHSKTVTWDTYASAEVVPDTVTADSAFFNYYYQVESYAATDTLSTQWFNRQLDSAIKYNGWFVPMYHNIGSGGGVVSLDGDAYTVTTSAFQAQMQAIASLDTSLWVAPFRDVVRYSKEYVSTSAYASSNIQYTNDSIVTIIISDTIKSPLFNLPLTLQISNLGACGCDVDSVKQAGKKLSFAWKKGYLQFNAIADSGNITIFKSPQKVTGVVASADSYFELYQNIPNPASATTTISYNLKLAGNVRLELFDITGTTFKTLVNEYQATGKHSYSLSTESLQAGVYFYRLTSGNAFDVKKMVVIK